jgi:alpha-tubulin suppressor-like RCC1 family protein
MPSDRLRIATYCKTSPTTANPTQIALTKEGEIYTWGRNKRGVLGYDESHPDVSKPKRVEALKDKKIIKIGCGADYNVALSAVAPQPLTHTN